MSERRSMGPQIKFCDDLHGMKYRSRGESYRDSINRVASAVSDRDSSAHYHSLRGVLIPMRFQFAGRIQAAMGAPREVTPFNCYVSGTIPDSFVSRDNPENSSIMHRAEQAATTMRMGGGIGYDFSTLRPRGDLIRKLQSNATGPVPFMHIYDAVCLATSSSGHRRGAQMGVLRVDHPDIVEFVQSKHNREKLTGFNISVAVTDDFMEAVERGSKFDLTFREEIYQTVDARELWELIMRSTWDWAEPGVLFIDTINNGNPLWYCERIAATNPCVVGETEILTREGWRRIDSLIDQTLDVWNGHQWSEVTPKITGRDQPLLRVSVSSGHDLTVTRYHKFILSDGSRVTAGELREGDRLEKITYPVVESGERAPDAYTQGFFEGDGWRDRRGRVWIGLFGAKKLLVDEFDAISSREYGCTGYEGTDTTQTSIRLYMGRDVLREKGFVPDVSWDVHSRLEWLAGLCDSDGSMTTDGAIQISSKSQEVCLQVTRLLSTLGVVAYVGPMKDCWRTGISASDIPALRDLGFRPRRLDISRISPQRAARRFVRVTSVEEAGVADTVYCLNEPVNHSCVFDMVYTAQCGEQPLPPFGACLLGSFNLTRYLSSSPAPGGRVKYSFDFPQLAEDIPHIVRAMDNVIDRATYPLPEQAAEARSKRRMGLGVLGLANALETMGLPYGSPGFLRVQKRIDKVIANEAYRASALLARERGSFELFDYEQYSKGEMFRSLDDDVRALIKKHGLRNSHLTSKAPTGTISMTADNVSSGIEPVFEIRTQRAVNTPEGPQIVTLEDYAYAQFGTVPRTTSQVTAQEHVDVLLAASRWTDSAVSKTCNVTGEMPWADFKEIYRRAWDGGAKGCTTFNIDGQRMALLRRGESGEGSSCTVDPSTGARSCE